MRWITRLHDERGAALVETAIVTIFLVILATGIIDVGRLLFTTISLNDATQEGAYYAAFTQEANPTSVQDYVRVTVDSPDLSASPVTVTCSDVNRQLRDAGTVTVQIQHQVDLLTPLLGGQVTLTREAESERLYPCW